MAFVLRYKNAPWCFAKHIYETFFFFEHTQKHRLRLIFTHTNLFCVLPGECSSNKRTQTQSYLMESDNAEVNRLPDSLLTLTHSLPVLRGSECYLHSDINIRQEPKEKNKSIAATLTEGEKYHSKLPPSPIFHSLHFNTALILALKCHLCSINTSLTQLRYTLENKKS